MRRTKQEAGRTREAILQAARRVAQECGVAETTMERVARAARVTRGAIYWHFAGKDELLQALCDEVAAPLASRVEFTLLQAPDLQPIERIRSFMVEVLDELRNSRIFAQTMEIMHFKCEYVGALEHHPLRYLQQMDDLCEQLSGLYAEAHGRGQLRPGLDPALAALHTCVFFDGLVRTWLLDSRATRLRRRALALVDAHLAGQSQRAPARAATGNQAARAKLPDRSNPPDRSLRPARAVNGSTRAGRRAR